MSDRENRSIANGKAKLPVFVDRFKYLIAQLGGQEEMSKKTGISIPTINYWKNGQRTPSAENLKTLSEKTQKSVDWFLGLTDENNYTTDETVRLVSEYTGLSTQTVEVLHLISQYPESGLDDATKINHSAIKLINLVFENAAVNLKKSDDDFTPLVDTLFTYLYRYICASEAEFDTDLCNDLLFRKPPKTLSELSEFMSEEEFSYWNKRIETARKLSFIHYGDIPFGVGIKSIAKSLQMDYIRKILDALSDQFDKKMEGKK